MSTVFAADCPDPAGPLLDAENALLEARVDDAEQAIATVAQSLTCGEVADGARIARYWLLRGAIEHFSGRAAEAAEAFVAGYQADPTVQISDFGPDFDKAVEVAVLEAPQEFGRLVTNPPTPDAEVMLNGRSGQVPVELDVGAYTVQLVRGREVLFGAELHVRPGVEHVLQTGLAARPNGAITKVSAVRKPVPGGLIAVAVAGGLALASGGLYLRENTSMRKATDLNELASARDRQIGFGVGAATLAGTSAAFLVVHLAR